ncbi:hypothetical protein Tco_0759929 [Tanacetum coccineum]
MYYFSTSKLEQFICLEVYLCGITINTNAWSDAGHSVNHIYDILYMMGRDDVAVGVGGEGGILEECTIQPNVGGYIPIIDQGSGIAGPCRYRQAIPVGAGGRLYKDTNFGYRKSFLPQDSFVVQNDYDSFDFLINVVTFDYEIGKQEILTSSTTYCSASTNREDI